MLSAVMTTLPTHPKQLMVYEALGWEAPEFGHMTLIINSETGKNCLNVDTNTLQFIEDYRKKAIFQKQSLTLSPFLVGTLVGKTKSSLVRN